MSYSFTALGLCPQDVALLQDKTKSHGHCLASTEADVDQSWLGKLRPSSVSAFRLLQARSKHIYMGFFIGCVGKFVVLFDCRRPFTLCTLQNRPLSSTRHTTMS